MLNSHQYKPFNTNNNKLKRFQNDCIIADQPDAALLNLPDEIHSIIFLHYTLDSFCKIRLLCKRLNKLADRKAEKVAFDNTLATCDPAQRRPMLEWWSDVLKHRANSFNDPSLIIEYMNFQVDPAKVVEFCMIDNISTIHFLGQTQPARTPRNELKAIIEFDADAILQYFVEVFEEEFKDDKWELMTNVKFHSFVWCLLVAFESFLTQVFKKHFLKMRLFPLFMNIMSKYSPAVVRLLLNSEIHGGSKRFPLLRELPYKVLRALLEHKDEYPFDLTSTMPTGKNISGDTRLFCLPPLEFACFSCSQSMFNEIAKHTPVFQSAGYFPALALSANNAEDRFYFYDGLLAKQIDLNGKLSPLLKSQKYSWIETVLGLVCFDYNKNDSVILIEWLLIHGARFSESELKEIGSAEKLRQSVKHILQVIQSNEKFHPFKNNIEWNPKQPDKFTVLNVVGSLTFEADENFVVRYGKITYWGKWIRGQKSNNIICPADRERTDIVLSGSYGDETLHQMVPSSRTFEYFAYKTLGGKLLLLREDAALLEPSMELIHNAWVSIKIEE
jgi:hypothetical protein